jgi:hypothetical protein
MIIATSKPPIMTFSGNSLRRLRTAVELACSDLRNQINMCPDVYEYSEDIEEIENELWYYEHLLSRIDRKLDHPSP